jgi:hypothetical protein
MDSVNGDRLGSKKSYQHPQEGDFLTAGSAPSREKSSREEEANLQPVVPSTHEWETLFANNDSMW